MFSFVILMFGSFGNTIGLIVLKRKHLKKKLRNVINLVNEREKAYIYFLFVILFYVTGILLIKKKWFQ